jgi:hypothetical protein
VAEPQILTTLRATKPAIAASPDCKLDTRQLAPHVVAEEGWDAADKGAVCGVAAKIVHALNEASWAPEGAFVRAGKLRGSTYGVSHD